MVTTYVTPWCRSELHHSKCQGRIENGLNVNLGLDSKGNPTRTPKGPYTYCHCPQCNHFPGERV